MRPSSSNSTRYFVDPPSRADHGSEPPAGNFVQNFERDLDIVLPEAAEGAAERIEQESFCLLASFRRQVFVLKR